VKIAVIEDKEQVYLVTAHNGDPFDDLDDLLQCLSFSSSGGDSGALGNGMKATMILANRISGNMKNEISVLSRETNGFIGAKTFIDNSVHYNRAPLEQSEIDNFEAILPSFFKDSNVIYINRVFGFSAEKLLTRIRIRAITEWVADDLLLLFKDGVYAYNNDIFSTTLPLNSKYSVAPYQLETNAIMNQRYARELFSSSVGILLVGKNREMYGEDFELEYDFRHIPMFLNADGEVFDFRNGVFKKEAPFANKIRIFSDFIDPTVLIESGIMSRVMRLTADPLYVTNLDFSGLFDLSPAFSKKNAVDNIIAIREAWDIAQELERVPIGIPKAITKMITLVAVDVRISPSSQRSRRYLVPGNYNELFCTQDSQLLRDMVNDGLKVLYEEADPALTDFVDAVESYIPKRDDTLAPLLTNVRRRRIDNIYVYDRNADGTKGTWWVYSKYFKVGKSYNVILTDYKHIPIEDSSLRTIGHNSGITFHKLAGKGSFKIVISDLFLLNIQGEIDKDSITPKEYLQADPNLVGPVRRIKFEQGSDVVSIVNSVDTPVLPVTVTVTTTSTPDKPEKKKGDRRGKSREAYFYNDNPDLLGRYNSAKGILMINGKAPDIVRHFDNPGVDDGFDGVRNDLYEEMQEAARRENKTVVEQVVSEYRDPTEHESELDMSADELNINEQLRTVLVISKNAKTIRTKVRESHLSLTKFKQIAKDLAGTDSNQSTIAAAIKKYDPENKGVTQPSVGRYLDGAAVSRGAAKRIQAAHTAWKKENGLQKEQDIQKEQEENDYQESA
jgi:hypothetical protein